MLLKIWNKWIFLVCKKKKLYFCSGFKQFAYA